MSFTNEEMERYSRHFVLAEVGESGQEKLRGASVLVIGAGGLGSPALLYLASAGVGTIGIADADVVDISNIQRQVIHSMDNIGKPKAESAMRSIKAINPDINVNVYCEYINSKNIMGIISGYDFILDCTDNISSKYLINDACVLSKKPYCHAGVIRFEGQVMTYIPEEGACYRCMFDTPPEKDEVPNCRQVGVLGAVCGVIGSVQATEAVKYILGIGELLNGRMFIFDGLKMSARTIKLPKDNSGCAVCGNSPTILQPVDL